MCDLTNLIVRIVLRGIIISELLIERLHPGLTLFFVHLEVILIQLILLSLAALSTRFSRRDSDFCWGNEFIVVVFLIVPCAFIEEFGFSMHKGKDETVKYTYITYAGVYSFIKYQDTVTKFLLVTP